MFGSGYQKVMNFEERAGITPNQGAMLVMPEACGQGLVVKILLTLSSSFKGKFGHVSHLCPDKASYPFRKMGIKEKIAQ